MKRREPKKPSLLLTLATAAILVPFVLIVTPRTAWLVACDLLDRN